MQNMAEWAAQWSHWVFIGALLVGALFVNRIVHWILVAAMRRGDPVRNVWRHAFLGALDAPVRALVWILAVYIGIVHFVTERPAVMSTVIYVLVTLVLTWFMLRMVNRVTGNYAARGEASGEGVDYTAVDAISKLAWAMVLIFAVLTILQTVGIPLSGLLAFGGAAGIAVGFAAQNLVGNLFGGLTVFASRIFKIGEAIILPGTDLAGDVEKIGWRSTRVHGWDGKPFYVPNSVFNTSTVINHSRMSHRTISENVLLRYEDFDKVEAIVREGNQMFEQREDIGYYVFRFASFGDNALKLAVYAYAQTDAYAEFMRIKEEVLMAIAAIVRKHQATLVLPLAHYRREDSAPGTPAATDGIVQR